MSNNKPGDGKYAFKKCGSLSDLRPAIDNIVQTALLTIANPDMYLEQRALERINTFTRSQKINILKGSAYKCAILNLEIIQTEVERAGGPISKDIKDYIKKGEFKIKESLEKK